MSDEWEMRKADWGAFSGFWGKWEDWLCSSEKLGDIAASGVNKVSIECQRELTACWQIVDTISHDNSVFISEYTILQSIFSGVAISSATCIAFITRLRAQFVFSHRFRLFASIEFAIHYIWRRPFAIYWVGWALYMEKTFCYILNLPFPIYRYRRRLGRVLISTR